MNRPALERLAAGLDPGAFELDPGIAIEGRTIAALLTPASPQVLGEMLSRLGAEDLRSLVRGGGTKLGLGNLPTDGEVVLSTCALSGVRRFEPEDGVVEASGGTPLRDVRAAVLERGWELPVDGGGADATLGGAIATGAYGPRCLGFGPVRRNVLGLEIVHASGKLTRCGGRVVKNVTGYDLAKLYTGSLGTLGVISGGWMRLQPKPRAIAVRTAEFSETDRALAAGLATSRRGTARACLLLSPDFAREVGVGHSLAASWVLVVELAGEISECERDAAWVEAEFSAVRPANHWGSEALATFDTLRDRFVSPLDAQPARLRIATLPTRLDPCVRRLTKTGARISIDPGLGLVHAETREAGQLEGLLGAAREAARACGGSLLFESLPSEAKRGLDVFGEPGAELEVMRRLKQQFDPDARLNPGRFSGGI
ncbi:MAG: FAD-binding oxidoreductase [bacterium]|nr:FAD-binding oxidoreductase [bacterium]